MQYFKTKIVLCAFLCAMLVSCSKEEKLPDGSNQFPVNLESINFDRRTIVRLNGFWHFWSGELLSPGEASRRMQTGSGTLIKVPRIWSRTGIFGSKKSLIKTGTLALELELPQTVHDWAIRLPNANSACTLFIDGQEASRIGTVADNPEDFIPNNGLKIVPFHTETGKVLLVMQVANFATPYTGTWDSPILGTDSAISDKRTIDSILSALISGAMLFMGLYHIALFLLRRKDKSPLLFGIICIFMSIRNLAMGERILIGLFPETWAGWQAAFTVEHLSAHMTLPLFFLFFRRIFPREIRKEPVILVCIVSGIWAILEIFTPAMFHHRFLPCFEYFLLVAALYLFCSLLIALRRKEDGAVIIISGISILLITIINDVFFSNGLIQSFYMASLGLFFFTFSQSFFLSHRFSSLFNMVERYTLDLENLNHSLERFIPHEMLGFLNKQSIIDVNLGDFSEQYMTVFFLDIRDFTTLSENMTPEENFRFINSFLERFGPIVRENGGFIDKYLGDGIMALFPGEPDDALDAALAMREMLKEFNRERKPDELPIRIGIGIHSGSLMLGTIGENQRMDSTVISDTVNTASRLEQLTKTHLKDILISAETKDRLTNPERYRLIQISTEKVKGRARSVHVFALETDDIPFLDTVENSF